MAVAAALLRSSRFSLSLSLSLSFSLSLSLSLPLARARAPPRPLLVYLLPLLRSSTRADTAVIINYRPM